MLQAAQSYDALRDGFEWAIPEFYNMGVDVCDKWAEKDPDRTAIIDLRDDTRCDISFADLRDMSNALAVHLRSHGVGAGDRVGVFRGQSPWTAAAHIAIWKLGAISVPLFYLFGPEALSIRLGDAGASAVIINTEGRSKVDEVMPELPALKTIINPEQDIPTWNDVEFAPKDTRADDPALLIYTSGTTGAPKGALHAHRVLLGHLPGVEMSHDFLPHEGDVMWTPADWAWIGGLLDVLMPALHHGIPVVAARMDKFSAQGCAKVIKRGAIRNVFFPPTALKSLMADDFAVNGLRSVASGGEPLGAALLAWGKRALGLTINEFYGQTECNMVVSSCAAAFPAKLGHIGRVVPGHTLAVLDDAGEPTLSEGNIAVARGTPVMMLEYWKNPKATQDKFSGEWLLTGDRGVIEEGYVRFVGRDDDVITSSGYRIGPAEVEDCLLTHPAVVAAAVVGKPCPHRTELVKAYVVLAPGYSDDQEQKLILQAHVKSRLAAHEYPREISFVETLPMTISGKIIRKDLRARAIAEAKEIP